MTVKVDLLPSERKRPKVFDGLTLILLLLLIPIGVLLYLHGQKLEGDIKAREKKIEELKKDIEQYNSLKLKIDQYKQSTQTIQQQVQLLKSLRDNARNYSVLLEEAKKIIPKNVWISNMDVSNNAIKYTCTALVGPKDGLETAALFIRNVTDSPTFSNPVISAIAKSEKSGFTTYSFTMSASYVLPGGGGSQ